jgi:hypothetical protein
MSLRCRCRRITANARHVSSNQSPSTASTTSPTATPAPLAASASMRAVTMGAPSIQRKNTGGAASPKYAHVTGLRMPTCKSRLGEQFADGEIVFERVPRRLGAPDVGHQRGVPIVHQVFVETK